MSSALASNRGILYATGQISGIWKCFNCHVKLLKQNAADIQWDMTHEQAVSIVTGRLRNGACDADSGLILNPPIDPSRTLHARSSFVWPVPRAALLALPLPRGKHSHVRDLVYASVPSSSIDGQDDVARGMQNDIEQQDPQPAGHGIDRMYVKLNFENGTCLKRTYTVFDQVTE